MSFKPSVLGGNQFSPSGAAPSLTYSNGETIPYRDRSVEMAMAHRPEPVRAQGHKFSPEFIAQVERQAKEAAEAKRGRLGYRMDDPLAPTSVKPSVAPTAAPAPPRLSFLPAYAPPRIPSMSHADNIARAFGVTRESQRPVLLQPNGQPVGVLMPRYNGPSEAELVAEDRRKWEQWSTLSENQP